MFAVVMVGRAEVEHWVGFVDQGHHLLWFSLDNESTGKIISSGAYHPGVGI